MADSKPRLSLYLNQYEQELLFNARFIPLLSGNETLSLPEIKDVLQAILYLTYRSVITNKNSLKGFVNGLIKKKNMPEIEYESEELDIGDLDELESQIPSEDASYGPIPYNVLKSRNVIFPLEKVDSQYIKEIQIRIKEIEEEIKFKIPEITPSELMKEAIHFVLGRKNKFRTRFFLSYIYVGSWYFLKPITSLKIFYEKSEVNKENVFQLLDMDEINSLIKICEDQDVFDKYISKAREFPFDYRNFRTFIELEKGHHSNVSGFNYQLAFFGFWLLYTYENIGMSMLPLIVALSMRYPIKKKEWNRMIEILATQVNYLLGVSQYIKDHKKK